MTADDARVHRLALVAIASAYGVHAVWLACVTDDAFITFRFARNLVRGHGLVWNAGGPPVEGYTNFLWMLFSALWIELGRDPGRGAQILGTLAGTGVILYVYRFARRLLGRSALEALVPVSLLAASGPHAAWATSGLETNLFALLVVASLYHFLAYEKWGERSALALACSCVFFGILTRPEGVLLLIGLCCAAPVLLSDRLGALARDGARPVGLLLVSSAIYFGWRWAYFGYPLPNTFYAKTGGGVDQLLRGLRHLGEFAACYVAPILPLGLSGFALSWRANDSKASDSARNISARIRANGAVWLCAAFGFAYTAYICAVGGDYMSMFRFFVPVLPFLYLLVGRAAAPFFGVASSGAQRFTGTLLLGLSLAGTLVHSTPLEAEVYPRTRTIHGTYRGIEFERWVVARLTQVGKFFAGHHREEEALATDAIGAVSYYSDMKVHGIHGLVDPTLAHARAPESMGKGAAGHDRANWNYLLGLRADYLVLGLPHFTAQPETDWPTLPNLPKEAVQRIRTEYEVVSELVGMDGAGPGGFFRFLQRKDRSVETIGSL